MKNECLKAAGLTHKYISTLTETFKNDTRVLKKCTALNWINYYESWDTNLCELQR